MAKIQLNGKQLKIRMNLSIKDLLKKHRLNQEKIAIELNGTILPKQKYKLREKKIAIELNGIILPKQHYGKKKLKNNDKIEIVQFIGGG